MKFRIRHFKLGGTKKIVRKVRRAPGVKEVDNPRTNWRAQ